MLLTAFKLTTNHLQVAHMVVLQRAVRSVDFHHKQATLSLKVL
jgi:hypothetical protein